MQAYPTIPILTLTIPNIIIPNIIIIIIIGIIIIGIGIIDGGGENTIGQFIKSRLGDTPVEIRSH